LSGKPKLSRERKARKAWSKVQLTFQEYWTTRTRVSTTLSSFPTSLSVLAVAKNQGERL
jgi:hypothetical protein